MKGKTYSLFGEGADSRQYYQDVRDLLNCLSEIVPDKKALLESIQQMSSRGIRGRLKKRKLDKALQKRILHEVQSKLSIYATEVQGHLRGLSVSERLDSIISTREFQYHLYMIEIELSNRIYVNGFRDSKYRFALIAHCLRDFRPDCHAESGEIEAICKSCTKECFVHLAGVLLKRYGIDPYISVEMEQEKLFKKLKKKHPGIGALGIACVPELVMGMRLCARLGIPAVGIPLDANRCARWMGIAHESSFSLEELEGLLND